MAGNSKEGGSRTRQAAGQESQGLLLGSLGGLGDNAACLLSFVQEPGPESGMGKKEKTSQVTSVFLAQTQGWFLNYC